MYQGQEQHYTGYDTPENRAPLWTSGYNTSAPLYQTAATLNKLRNKLIADTNSSSTTFIDSLGEILFTDDNHLCMSKGPSGSNAVFCIVNQSSSGAKYTLSIGGFQSGDSVVEVLSCTTGTADSNGNVTMYMDKGAAQVYTLLSNVNGTGLCNTTEDAATAASSSSSDAFGLGPNFGLGVSFVLGCVGLLFAM